MNKIIFLCRKSEQKLALTPKQKKTKLQWAKEKQSWSKDRDDAGTFAWCSSNEIYKDDCLKTIKCPHSFMIRSCMPGKGLRNMAVNTSAVNAQVYIELLDTFVQFSLMENTFGDEVIFQDDKSSCHTAKISE